MSFRRNIEIRAVAVFAALTLPLAALAESTPVVIKNTTANPVPVVGNVNATVQGTPNVNATISGTPTVNIGTMPAAPNPEKSPFYIQYGTAGGASIQSQFGFISPNTIFVIESESAYCFVTQGTQLLYAFVGGSEGSLYLPFQKTGTDGNYDYYTATLPNRMYAQGNGTGAGDLFFDFFGHPAAGTTPVTNCSIYLMGHLVALP
ncbi:MAG TPA: hypothetical protein VMQ45_04555 [Burkholderiaceae bacterium]|nr:hypothetical protein [Burkholderiaceae bacterium]